ncbi:hypothetical protein QBC40DRAFT_296898 [Triangularia verruculosa]|uniref:Uncharacterized protein n=1 Tax=Triangularia verruculosa TaxID=2587418 RepID=A0AAN6XIV7_9PEZI|nr:hypothetical protein QBC40DRAFT_296898 [Triangularia verruculosa]
MADTDGYHLPLPLGEGNQNWIESWPSTESPYFGNTMDFSQPSPYDLPTMGSSFLAESHVAWSPVLPGNSVPWYDLIGREQDCDEWRRNPLGSHNHPQSIQHFHTPAPPMGLFQTPLSYAPQTSGSPITQNTSAQGQYSTPEASQHSLGAPQQHHPHQNLDQQSPQDLQQASVMSVSQNMLGPTTDNHGLQSFQPTFHGSLQPPHTPRFDGLPNMIDMDAIDHSAATPFNTPTTMSPPPIHPVPIPALAHVRHAVSTGEEHYRCTHLQTDGQICEAEFNRHFELDRHIEALHTRTLRATCHDCNPPHTYSRHDCWRRHWRKTHALRFIEERGDEYFQGMVDEQKRQKEAEEREERGEDEEVEQDQGGSGGKPKTKRKRRGKRSTANRYNTYKQLGPGYGEGNCLGLIMLTEEKEIALDVWKKMKANGRNGPLFEERKRKPRWYMREVAQELERGLGRGWVPPV